jgi:GT2 family glycosyltransferase
VTAADDAPAAPGAGPAPVTVVIPTIGRAALLADCLASLAACDPPPGEVLVVDQSGTDDIARMVQERGEAHVRVLPCAGRGISLGLNTGLRAAAHDLVMVTNDDCTVRPDWVGVAHRRALEVPGGIVTGQVRPPEEDAPVPSTKVDPVPHDYTGEVVIDALYGGNMILSRDDVLALGGFDERPGMRVSSEDNDLCYRWLRAGRSLRYEPTMVVWHHDWRTPEELAERYAEYARGNGVLYAKYLLRGDRSMLRLAAREYRWGLRSLAGAVVRRRRAPDDPRWAIVVGLPAGFAAGVGDELRARRAGRAASTAGAGS